MLGIVLGTRQATLPVLSELTDWKEKQDKKKMQLSQGVVPRYEKYRVIWEHTGGTLCSD